MMSGCGQRSQQQNDFPQPNEGGSQSFGGGWGFRRGIDEETLQLVADMTGGEYYSAESANELEKVFQDLPISYIFRQEQMEISVAFTAFAAVLAGLAVALSLIWHSLP
jgi:Ca-activated chloride channel family protein